MKKWKKNLLAASVLLVVCAGIYTNWVYTNAQNVGDLTDALDYSAVENEVVKLAENSSFYLLEALLNAIGTAVTGHPEVISCKVHIEKPAASKYGRSVALEGEFDSQGWVG